MIFPARLIARDLDATYRPLAASRASYVVSWLAAGLFSCILLTLIGCGRTEVDASAGKTLHVFAAVPPLSYLVEQVGGRHVTVGVLVQPGQDPHTFETTPQQVMALGRASVYFAIDMPFERAILEKVHSGNRGLVVVNTIEGITRLAHGSACDETGHDAHTHDACPGEPDPHVWLSPPLLRVLAKNVAAGLSKADPKHQRDYDRNLADLLARIDAVHRRAENLLAPYRGRSFYVFHPGFGYFADAFGLLQRPVESAGREPTAKQLRALSEQARADRATTIFVQPQTATQGAEVVAQAIGGKVVVINGLRKNVLTDIEDIAEKIEKAMKNEARDAKPNRRDAENGLM